MTSALAVESGKEDVSAGRIGALPFIAVVAQLGVLALVLRQFQIESGAFLRLLVLAFGGFAVHALLPIRFRLAFFLGLSFGGIALVLGVVNGIWLVAIGLVLIAICHLPVPFSGRVALLVAVGAGLALQRADWLPAPWPAAIWPILGSMFMFRLIVYLYDLRTRRRRRPALRTLSYFFMLPNVCFPLFPVVDYKTFRRTYYDDDAYADLPDRRRVDGARGRAPDAVPVRLLVPDARAGRGARTPATWPSSWSPTSCSTCASPGSSTSSSGMLHLFGFHLPRRTTSTSSPRSFTDFWRRINIYWKDFMLKIFYYPAYFRLASAGPRDGAGARDACSCSS